MKEGRERTRRLSNEGKRSVHVKWDGKTIALGTFPDKEASIMCKRARALTKIWRVVDPKPNVEEVKQSLERLGIRVVNERPGRQSKKNNNTTTNRKRRKMTVEEGISSVYGIQQNFHSLVSDVIGTPPHTIATITTNQHPYADSIANIAERGTPPPPPSYNNSRTDSFMITPKEPIGALVISSFASSHQSVSICSHQDSNNPIAAPIIKLEADSEVQGIEQVAQPGPHTIATAMTNQHPCADSIANIVERGTPPTPPSYNHSRTDSFMITPKEPISGIVIPSFASSHQSVSIGSYQDSNNPITAPIIKLDAGSEVKGIEQVAQSDMELHSDITYQMLEKHYLTIQDEVEEIRKLMLFYKQRLPKRKNEKLINQRVGIQTYPTIIHQIPNSPTQSYQDYKSDETELSEAEEMTELKTLLSDSEDNDSVAQMILLEDW